MTFTKKHMDHKPAGYFDFLEACLQNGCPVCSLLSEQERRYLDSLFYENVNDLGVREMFRLSLGFCVDHAALLSSMGDAFGVAILYKDLLEHILKALDQTQFHNLESSRQCPVCVSRKRRESGSIQNIVRYFHETELQQALHSSSGLCLEHLHYLVREFHDEHDRQIIVFLHGERLKQLRNDLSEFIRKQDAQYHPETISTQEGSSCRRAIHFFAGPIS